MNDEKENVVIEEKKGSKRKKIILLSIMLLTLAIIFILYGSKPGKTPEVKVLEYLEEKYVQNNFEISKLSYSGQYENPPIGCDGSNFIPARKVKDKYEYYYEVLSKNDNVKFDVYYLDDKGTDSFKDTYEVCKNINDTIDKISNKIVENFGNENTRIKSEFTIREKTLRYDCKIDIILDENIDEVLNQDYIDLLYNTFKTSVSHNINSFRNKYTDNLDTYVNFEVKLSYADGKYVSLYPNPSFFVYEENDRSGVQIETYWRSLND